MTRNSSTRNNIFRTAFQAIATLALAVSLVACGDSISGPTSNPTTNTGGGTTGNGGNGGNGAGNGGTTAGKNSVTLSANGKTINLDMGNSYALLTYGGVSITLTGTSGGRSFSVFLLNDALNNGNGTGRYVWNSSMVTTASMAVGWTTWSGYDGATVITSIDRLDGRVRGSFKGMIVESADNANKMEISGTFDVQLTF